MGARVCLTEDGNFYLVLKYENSDIPHFKTCFPYNNGTKEETLKKARNFARGISENSNLPLEEKLNHIQR